MERAVVVGNCQAAVLERILLANDAFAERFAFTTFPAVHEIPEATVPELHDAVAEATVLVVQRIDEGYRDGVGLGTETLARIAGSATVIRWPSVFWAGYFPELCYLRDATGRPVTDGPFDLHDRTIVEAFADGVDVAGACALLAEPERPSSAPAHASAATAELARRGEGLDVHVDAFIAERFRDELLFFTMNHPTHRVLGHVADQITRLLGLPGGADLSRFRDQMLGTTFYPLHANHVRALGLHFGPSCVAGSAPFLIRGVACEAADVVAAFYAYYEANPELVEVNLDRAPPA
jgi:hypothetical protein